ncbi:MAG TPA: response regulator transcription factor [Bacillales bacterium]|nr:response regulator transcription factor [Bacillales bacterium]
MAIKVLLADDHLVVLQGLRFFLGTQKEFRIVGEASNGREAVQLCEQEKPDVILMDLMMPDMDGIEATKVIKQRNPNVKIIILTSFSDQDHVVPAIRAGAEGYQLKDIRPEALANTIRAAYRGEKLLHPEATQQLLSHVSGDGVETTAPLCPSELTPREKEVLEQITLGKSNKEIAHDLYITEKTVKTHVSNLLSKLDLHDRTQAAILAMKNKWFD